MILTVLQVAIGGAIGASGRYLLGTALGFPYGTLAVNIIGSFLMGLAFVAIVESGLARWAPFVMAGVLGGFTTFAAFSLDILVLYEAERFGAAAGYILASVVLSFVALFVGVALMRGLQG